ncbi:(2Fe-2S) ferredoxin domain-containing protein [Leptolyngbya sp. FACHB-36]|uniref:(2Fe-2S) ferredoxin domain-containing protein n=1 Tax=Leptolyngbya sp. FACHB-36 TaxID=2692808 RepID=UPI0016803731|nr:(2Fe-2S) ferredoxin domain-containing protein [Leptolyngbya sp. FACHB-36]MBD2021311.1 (2Fe-2S) ferredoxin domain-containing protein [Leptolyngbya sp. FACHB-36]
MGKHNQQPSLFSLEGRFLGFITKDGYKLKHLRLMTTEGEYCIKLTKESRASVSAVGAVLMPGDWIYVWGEKSGDRETGAVKLKAHRIHCGSSAPAAQVEPVVSTPQPAKATILMCQKSDCMKRGGKAVCAALQAELNDRGLDHVTIQGTGCMKRCKAGPNLVMPDKTRYSKINASDVPEIVTEHFPCAQPQTASTNAAKHPAMAE